MSDYFVKVTDAKSLRRRVLEGSKASINILRSYHALKTLRKQKLEAIQQVQEEFKELTMLVNSLSDSLPALTKQEVQKIESLDKIPKSRKKSKGKHVFMGEPERVIEKKPKKEELPELEEEPKSSGDELHDKLAEIESKLSKL